MAISNPEITINGTPIAIVPNTFVYDEGETEKMVRAAVIGDNITQEFSENVEEAFTNFKFSIYPNVDNIEFTRTIEKNRNENIVSATAVEVVSGVQKTWRRTFNNASIADKVDKPMGADTTMELTFKSDAAV